MGKSVNQSRPDILVTWNALKSSPVLALESLPKPGAVLSKMWVMASVKLILVSNGRLMGPPSGWSLSWKAIRHNMVGRVTDITTHIGIYFRCNQSDVVSALGASRSSAHLKRRWLSMAGDADPQEQRLTSHRVGEAVQLVRPGVMMNSGLLGVKTLHCSNMWVIRPLTPSEVIACWDVPKKLGRLFETKDDRISLMKEMFGPLKIRQLALEDLRPFMSKFLESESEKATERSKVQSKALPL
jgi:hypothetical protein